MYSHLNLTITFWHILTQMEHFSAKSIFSLLTMGNRLSSSLDRMVSEWNLYSLKANLGVRQLQGLAHILLKMTAPGSKGRAVSSGLRARRWRAEAWGKEKERRPAWAKAADFDSQRLHFHFSFTERMLRTRGLKCFQKITLCTLSNCHLGRWPGYIDILLSERRKWNYMVPWV